MGIVTGLVPGIHVNLVAQVLLALSIPLYDLLSNAHLNGLEPLFLSASIIGCTVVHTYMDIIPSVFLGAPDEDNVLSVLPGHRMMLAGRGIEAVKMSLLGSLGATAFSVFLLVPFRFTLGPPVELYAHMENYVPYLLLVIMGLLVLFENPREGMPFLRRLSSEKWVASNLWKEMILPEEHPSKTPRECDDVTLFTGILLSCKRRKVRIATKSGTVSVEGTLHPTLSPGRKVKVLAQKRQTPGVAGHLLSRAYSLLLILLAGFLGLLVLGVPGFSSRAESYVLSGSGNLLMPMLTGLFGVSGLIISLKDQVEVPEQEDIFVHLPRWKTLKAVLSGTLAGSLVGWLPGVTSSQATTLSSLFHRTKEEGMDQDRFFLISVSAVNTSNAFFVLLALFTIGKARSGAISGVAQLLENDLVPWNKAFPPDIFILLLISACAAGGFAYLAGTKTSTFFGRHISKVKYKPLAFSVLVFLVLITFLFSGPLGLIILVPSTALGMLPPQLGVKRVHLMACIMLPVVLFLLNVDTTVLALVGFP